MLKVIDAAQRRVDAALRRAPAAGVRRAALRARLEKDVAIEDARRPEITPLCAAEAPKAMVSAAALDAMVSEVCEESAARAAAGPASEVPELA